MQLVAGAAGLRRDTACREGHRGPSLFAGCSARVRCRTRLPCRPRCVRPT